MGEDMIHNIICLVIGYFCGCISSGYFVGKFHHIDIREHGSGNAGTTNVLRVLGKLPALITFVGDLAKAVMPILVIRIILSPDNWDIITLFILDLRVEKVLQLRRLSLCRLHTRFLFQPEF